MSFQPLIIVGAARSGTNILRDLLSSLTGAGTWPCDEINYIWRYANARHPTDELTALDATPRVKTFVRRKFQQLADSRQLHTVVEKTCANSLRIPFVASIFPTAQYVHIVRDGRDVVASARLRWKAPLDFPYLLKKARWVPLADLPYYATRYLFNRLHRIFSSERRTAFWGPSFEGLDAALRHLTLEEVCALQWQRSVESAHAALSSLDDSRVFLVKYESLAQNPAKVLADLGEFLQMPIPADVIQQLAASVSPNSVGKWRSQLSLDEVRRVEAICSSTLRAHGYL